MLQRDPAKRQHSSKSCSLPAKLVQRSHLSSHTTPASTPLTHSRPNPLLRQSHLPLRLRLPAQSRPRSPTRQGRFRHCPHNYHHRPLRSSTARPTPRRSHLPHPHSSQQSRHSRQPAHRLHPWRLHHPARRSRRPPHRRAPNGRRCPLLGWNLQIRGLRNGREILCESRLGDGCGELD